MERRIYTLNDDVRNPKPDRRCRNVASAAPVWQKGSLWLYTEYRHGPGSWCVPPVDQGPLQKVLRCQGMTGDITEWGTPVQWSALFPQLVEFDWVNVNDRRQFQALKLLMNLDYELLIHYFFATGQITRDMLVVAQAAIDEMADAADVWKVQDYPCPMVERLTVGK